MPHKFPSKLCLWCFSYPYFDINRDTTCHYHVNGPYLVPCITKSFYHLTVTESITAAGLMHHWSGSLFWVSMVQHQPNCWMWQLDWSLRCCQLVMGLVSWNFDVCFSPQKTLNNVKKLQRLSVRIILGVQLYIIRKKINNLFSIASFHIMLKILHND